MSSGTRGTRGGRHPGTGFVGVGVDVARGGADKTVLAIRFGNVITHLLHLPGSDTMAIAEEVLAILDQCGGSRGGTAVVDVIGVGAGVVDRLRQLVREGGRPHRIEAFNAGERTSYKDATGELEFANARAAMWWNLKEMLDRPEVYGVALPREGSAHIPPGLGDELTGDLTTPRYGSGANGRILVESKEQIRKRIGRSTDAGDAVAMIMYYGAGRRVARQQAGQFPGVEWMQRHAWGATHLAMGSGGRCRYGGRERGRLDSGENVRW